MSLGESEIIQRLQRVDEYAFEQFVAQLWERRGWNTEVTNKSNDKGIDVIATRSVPYPEKEIIQAKRYHPGNRVSSPELQQYASLTQQEQDADKVIVVCTSGFTDEALGIAEQTNVKCVNGTLLAQMISELDATDLVEQYTGSANVDNIQISTQQSNKQNSKNRETLQGSEPLTLVEHGDRLTVELVGLGEVNTTTSSGSLLSRGSEIDGIIAALKLFNQTDKTEVIEKVDSFSFVDHSGNTYTPVNLGKGEFNNGWKKHGGGISLDQTWIEPGSRVKYAVGVSLPSHSKVTEIRCDKYDIHFKLDHEVRRKLADLPEGIKSALSN